MAIHLRWRAGLAIAAVPLVGACYVYRPVATPAPQPGTQLAIDLNDAGRAALVTSVGPEVEWVEGALVADSGGDYVLRVSVVSALHGSRTKWSGETVSLREGYVKRIRERRFSGGRTAFLVAGLVGAMVGLVAGADLLGAGGDGDGKAGGGPGGEQ